MLRTRLLACLALAAVAVFAAPARADHWKRHDGRWYYWNDGDTRWYYMDGRNWFYNADNHWNVYKFDKKFGHDRELDDDELEIDDDDIVVPKYAPPPVPPPARIRVKPD